MRTLVELRINQIADSKIIKEVINLTKINTPKPKEIQAEKDPIDDKLILIIFESYKGKQVDLVDGIITSYTHNLESYSDISVFFETREKQRKVEERLKLGSKRELIALVERYHKSEKENDIELMSTCLDERIVIKPKPTIRSSMNGIKKSTYLDHMKKVLSKIKVNHEIREYWTKRDGYRLSYHCQIKTKGISKESSKEFESIGEYEYRMKRTNENKLEITEIIKRIKEIKGDKKVYETYMN